MHQPAFYFRPPKGYFWCWADNTEVIEWRNRSTICYRDELIYLLKECAGLGFPPLDPILLMLAACNKGIPTNARFVLMRIMKRYDDPQIEKEFDDALQFLQMIHNLPQELRTGDRRIHLLHELFGRENFALTNNYLNDALDNLRSGRLDSMIVEEGDEVTKEQFQIHIGYFSKALKKYPSQEKLELMLRTGLDAIPQPVEVEVPETLHGDLFTILEQDKETIGVARLARRIASVISIPMHSQGSGDRSYGGLSDITNRGNYDRLLLSELAHDDLLLMARLVNNEALYFRREEPPDNPKRKRTILLDSTIKMWGVPRVFALSAGLAFAHNSKHGEIVEAYTLGGENYTSANLSTKQGIVESLEMMHHALHCGKALYGLINDLPDEELNEYILITEANLLHSAAFHEWFAKTREAISFVITVNRIGELNFYECTIGKLKLLNKARLDLEELLFAPADHLPVKRRGPETEPAFFSYIPSPLLSPKVRIKLVPRHAFDVPGKGVFIINETQRLLYISNKQKGALELLNYIEKGKYFYGWNGRDTVYILILDFKNNSTLAYSVNIHTCQPERKDLSDTIKMASEAYYKDDKFYIGAMGTAFYFNYRTMNLKEIDKKTYEEVVREVGSQPENPVLSIDPMVHYSVMYKIREMYIDAEGSLVLGNYVLSFTPDKKHIRIREVVTKKDALVKSKETCTNVQYLLNRNIKFVERTWPDGSTAIIDSRGFLHLKSSDAALPEVTIVLAASRTTACWAQPQTVCGAEYFINENLSPVVVSVETFYERFIQPYINRILKG